MADVTNRKVYNKLVRDRIPDVIHARGARAIVHPLDEAAYLSELKKKLLEEAEEVMRAASFGEVLEELADVLQVLESLAEAHGVQISAVQSRMDAKKKERGAFAQRL